MHSSIKGHNKGHDPIIINSFISQCIYPSKIVTWVLTLVFSQGMKDSLCMTTLTSCTSSTHPFRDNHTMSKKCILKESKISFWLQTKTFFFQCSMGALPKPYSNNFTCCYFSHPHINCVTPCEQIELEIIGCQKVELHVCNKHELRVHSWHDNDRDRLSMWSSLYWIAVLEEFECLTQGFLFWLSRARLHQKKINLARKWQKSMKFIAKKYCIKKNS